MNNTDSIRDGIYDLNSTVKDILQELKLLREDISKLTNDNKPAKSQPKELTNEEKKAIREDYKGILRTLLEGVVDKQMTFQEALLFKAEIVEFLKFFADDFNSRMARDLRKCDRIIGKKTFDACMKFAGLPYSLDKPKQSIYVVRRKTNRE